MRTKWFPIQPPATVGGSDLPADEPRSQQAVAYLNQYGFFLELLGLVVSGETVDDLIEGAVHDEVELMNRESDSMIGDPVVFEVIGTDLF